MAVSEPEESVLIGLVFDVSGSMERHVTRSSRRSESWASSIFRVMDDLLSGDDLWKNEVFAFGAGAMNEPVAFDILRTLDPDDFDDIHKSVMEEKPLYEKYGLQHLVTEIMNLLEANGAPNIRGWTTDQQVTRILTLEDAAQFLVSLQIDECFLTSVVDECLPGVCRFRTKGNHLLGFVDSAASFATSNSTKEEEVRLAIKNAKKVWSSLHSIISIDSSRAIFDGKRALKILRGSALTSPDEELTNERVDELMELVEPYIYGATPLIRTLNEAVKVFRRSRARKKVLLVLSDGEPDEEVGAPVDALRDMGVYVVCCYVTDRHIQGRRLYSVENPNWSNTAKFMFNLSSTISTQHVPKTVFVKRNWLINFANNETKLFTQVNNPDLLKDVTQLVRDVACSQDSLSDLLGSVSLDLFINKVNDEFSPQEQVGGTCYANAAAAVMYMAMKRIYKRQATPQLSDQYPDPSLVGYPYLYEDEAKADPDNFICLREELIDEFGKEGARTSIVLSKVCPRYRLRCKKVNLVGAMEAVSCKRPVVATFKLTEEGWNRFRGFYLRTPRGTLDKSDVDQRTGKGTRGHAVVLTSYNSQGLRFMNSWGTDWADSGFFVAKRDALPKLKFYDVFWEESDLTEIEKQAYAESGNKVAENLISKYQSLNKLTFACPECGQVSPMIEYRSSGDNAVCPECQGQFPSRGRRPELSLCLYLHSLARNARSEQNQHSPTRDARSERNQPSPTRDARSEVIFYSVARDARSERIFHSLTRDARSGQNLHTPTRDARFDAIFRVPTRDAGSEQNQHSPTRDARSERSQHSPTRDARSEVIFSPLDLDARSELNQHSPTRDARSEQNQHYPTRDARYEQSLHSPTRDARSEQNQHSATRDARSVVIFYSPDRDARSEQNLHSPTRDARSEQNLHSPTRDARSEQNQHSPTRDARSEQNQHSPTRDDRSEQNQHSPTRDAGSEQNQHSPTRDAGSEQNQHSPTRYARSVVEVTFRPLDRDARSERSFHSPTRNARFERSFHSPTRNARSDVIFYSLDQDARSERSFHSPPRGARNVVSVIVSHLLRKVCTLS